MIDDKGNVSFPEDTYPNVIMGKRPIKLWLGNIEKGALDQARNVANLPFLFKHVAIMPDAHQGYGMPIGGVAALENAISPNMVGVDIGCGVCAIKTTITDIHVDLLKKIIGEIRKIIPVGFEHHKYDQNAKYMPNVSYNEKTFPIVIRQRGRALKQIGTLGGGNHLMEIQKGSD